MTKVLGCRFLTSFWVVTALSVIAAQSPASAQLQSTLPFGSDKETSRGAEYEGWIDGVYYSYMLSMDNKVVNGVVDGPSTSPGAAMNDPDRWVITVDRDKMTDAERWYIHHYQTGLMLRVDRAARIIAICVVGGDYPSRPISVRVGTAKAITLANCSSTSAAVLQSQLMKGGRLLVRRYEWPYDYGQDKEGEAVNFDKAIRLFKWLARIK